MSKFFTLFLLVPISFLLGSNWFPILESNINQPTNITKENMCVDVQLSVFLEGPYDSNINQMTTYLNYGQPDDFLHRGMLPGQVPTNTLAQPTPPGQPYNLAPWNYTGTITENTFSGPYDLDVVDWILISFREDIHPSTEFAKTVGLLYKDGHIEFLNP